jgi:hypothetical protein
MKGTIEAVIALTKMPGAESFINDNIRDTFGLSKEFQIESNFPKTLSNHYNAFKKQSPEFFQGTELKEGHITNVQNYFNSLGEKDQTQLAGIMSQLFQIPPKTAAGIMSSKDLYGMATLAANVMQSISTEGGLSLSAEKGGQFKSALLTVQVYKILYDAKLQETGKNLNELCKDKEYAEVIAGSIASSIKFGKDPVSLIIPQTEAADKQAFANKYGVNIQTWIEASRMGYDKGYVAVTVDNPKVIQEKAKGGWLSKKEQVMSIDFKGKSNYLQLAAESAQVKLSSAIKDREALIQQTKPENSKPVEGAHVKALKAERARENRQKSGSLPPALSNGENKANAENKEVQNFASLKRTLTR